jgi:signal transduction histidine kinase
MQIRTRLTLQFILITAGIFTLALLFIYTQFRNQSVNEFFAVLESKARMTAAMVLQHEEALKPIAAPVRQGPGDALPYGESIAIYNESFQRVFAINPSGADHPASTLQQIRERGSGRFSHGKQEIFGVALKSGSGKTYYTLAEGYLDDARLMQLRTILIFTFFLIVGFVAAGGWFYAGQALQPVSRIVSEVDHLLPTDLSKRLKHDNQRDELSHLVATFNRLLDRIEHAFRMQKSFISNVSHELKNPLAAMDAQLQLARQKDRSRDEYQTVLASLHDDVREITDTAEKLLQLAKVHSEAANIIFSNVRLDEIIFQTRDALLKAHPDYSIVFEIQDMPEEEEHLFITGNEPLLRTALMNLFDNGCKFSPDRKVHVFIRFRDNGAHEVEIQDNGPGIPEEDIQRIFEPFFRSPQHSHIKGSGVGLSLVQSILKLHGVVLDVFSGQSRSGATFRLRFSTMMS